MALLGCGSPSLVLLDSLSAKQPRVVSVVPENGTSVEANAVIRVTFSSPVSSGSVNPYSFALIQDFKEGPDEKIIGDLEDGDLTPVDGKYGFDSTGETVEFIPNEPLSEGVNYGVVVTTEVENDENLPLNNPYVGTFTVAPTQDTNTDIHHEDDPPQNNDESNNDTETDEEKPPPETGDGDTDPPTLKAEAIINEIYYDAKESDTDGYLFVELKGDIGGDISNYKISFINGEDGKVTESIILPEGIKIGEDGLYVVADLSTGSKTETKVSQYDFLDNFDPQNGPDAAELFNDKGELLDAVCYGEPKVLKDMDGFDICEGSFAPDVPAGKSITRTTGSADTNNNSIDFVVNEKPSPGVE